MNVREYLTKTFKIVPYGNIVFVREHAVCNDGFRISIQASAGHYCIPRRTLANGRYSHLELGYPSEYEPLLDEYKEGTIFPYVPIEVVEKVIEKHGGIK